MKQNLKSVCEKIIHHCEIDISEKELDLLLPRFEFNYMKANLEKFQPITVKWRNNFEFIRNGKIGDGSLNKQQLEMWENELKRAFPNGIPKSLEMFCKVKK